MKEWRRTINGVKMEKTITNDYNEKISREELKELVERIRKLPEQKIDDLWFRSGYIYKSVMKNDGGNNAISNRRLHEIKRSEAKAYEFSKDLFIKIHIAIIRKNLNQIEKEKIFTESHDILAEETFSNENGEKISREELKELVERIRKLPEQKIDDLWFRVGFIYEKKGNNTALHPKSIKEIKKSTRNAEVEVLKLFDESKISDIYKNLDTLEKSR